MLGSTSCSTSDLSVTATSCSGFYSGNLDSGRSSSLNDSAAIVNALLGTSYTGSTLPILESLPSLSGKNINFNTALYGQTLIAVHVGAAKGQSTGVGYQGTAFYLFDAGNLKGGLDTFTFNRAGLSNARLFATGVPTPAVPEPGTWMLLLVGFGFVGAVMRRRNRRPAQSLGFRADHLDARAAVVS